MKLTETQEVLLQLLRTSGVGKNNTIAVMVMLKENEDIMQQMAIWIYDNHPSEEQIMRKAIEMSDKLTLEEVQ